MSWAAVIVGGAAVVGGGLSYMSNKKAAESASDSQQYAADRQAQVTWDMYNTARSDQQPFYDMGVNEMANTFGYSAQPVIQGGGYGIDPATQQQLGGTGAAGGSTAPAQAGIPEGAKTQYYDPETKKTKYIHYDESGNYTTGHDRPQSTASGAQAFSQAGGGASPGGGTVVGMGYVKSGEGIDPTGGAGQYMQNLEGINPNLVGGNTAGTAVEPGSEFISGSGGNGAGGGVDPTGGASKYMQQLEALEFKMDPTDEIYKWRESETNRAINQAAAARGNWNSRPTINALADANMGLQADEIDRQYKHNYLTDYGKLTDLYNMSLQLGGTEYNAAQDEYNRKYGQQMDLYNMAMQGGQAEYAKGLDAIKAGQGAAGSMGSGAIAAGSQLSSIYGNLGNAQATNALWQGQNTANLIGGTVNSGLNAMALYNLNK